MNLDYEFAYAAEPIILVRVRAPSTGEHTLIRALIDTGAQRTLLDYRVAARLRLDLSNAPLLPVSGLGGGTEARFAEVELQLLDAAELTTRVEAGFISGLESSLRNLIGLDALTAIDFGISHTARLGYLGRAVPPDVV